MQVSILGPVSLETEGKRHDIRATKVRTMFATLVLEAGRSVSHVELADELWPGEPVGNMRNALQAHATRLRKVLAEESPRAGDAWALRTVHNGYLLDIPRDRIDGNIFLDRATQGAAALAHQPQRALEVLESALDLWHGPALLDAGDGLRCRGAAAQFEERRLTAQEDLIRARLAVGGASRAVAELRRLVPLHPLRERLYELLMLALYRSGRQGESLELFDRARRRLDEELGVLPGLPLQRLHAGILSHDPALQHPSTAVSGSSVVTHSPSGARSAPSNPR